MRLRILAGAALLAACRSGSPDLARDASIVLISIDTLRADRLPAYGYSAGATPHLDGLAREGIVFEDAYVHCPLTLPAHVSMFTGRLPPRHGVRDNLGFTLPAGSRPLAARLREVGWATGGAVSAFVLRSATGIAQGFDFYDDAVEIDPASDSAAQQRDGAAAVESLARWVEGQTGRRFFAFLHLYEPHAPYAPPAPHGRHPEPYDGEVAYADELVGRFLSRLRAAGILERSILVVTSDHGEGLGDHGEQEHGFFLYRESLRVPLIVRLPGGARGGRRVPGLVAQADLAPTLLELAGLPADGMDGVSLRRAIEGGRHESRPVYAETFYPRLHFGWSELLSVTDDRYHYVRAPRPELYDRRADPGETRNLATERGSAASAMNAWLEKTVRVGDVPAPGAVTEETREALRALGYVGGAVPPPASGALADPKDKVGVYESFRRAVALRGEGREADAVAELRRLLRESPGMLDAWEELGLALLRSGRSAEGVAALDRVVARDPRRPTSQIALARHHGLAGRLERAEAHATIAAAVDPGRGHEVLALLALQRKRTDAAADHARKSLAGDPSNVMSHYVVGAVARQAGRCQDAIESFRRARDAQSRQRGLVVRGLHAGMGDCLARLGREAEAESEFEAELAAIPHSGEARVGLAMLYRAEGRDDEARAALEGVVTAHPRPGADEYWTVVRTFTVLGDQAAARRWAAQARARYPADRRFRSSP